MKKQDYIRYLSFFNHHPQLKKGLLTIAKMGPILTFISYILLLFLLILKKSLFFYQALLIPASCFITTTVLRKICRQPRPFEVYAIEPLIRHEQGESFPSRHSASALIIALTVLQYQAIWGYLLMIDALLIGISRILIAVHFPRDILGGYLLAILFSTIYLII